MGARRPRQLFVPTRSQLRAARALLRELPEGDKLAALERAVLVAALEEAETRVIPAAERLGINATVCYRLLHRHGLDRRALPPAVGAPARALAFALALPSSDKLTAAERVVLLAVVQETKGNVLRAALELGVNRSGLHRRLTRLFIHVRGHFPHAWQPYEDTILKKRYASEGAEATAKDLPGRSVTAVRVRANRLRLRRSARS